MRRTDLITAGLLVVLGLVTVFLVIPTHVSGGAEGGDLSPAFMPYVAAALGTISMASLFVARLARRTPDAPPPLPKQSWYFICTAAIVLIVAFALMERFGYLIGAAAIVAGFMALARAGAKVVVGAAISLPIGLWLLFDQLLGFPLP